MLPSAALAQQGQVQRALAQPRLPGHDLPLDRRERFLRMRHIGLRGDGDPQVARGHDRGSQGAVAQVDTLTDDEQFGDAPRVILAQGLLVDRLVEQETADQLDHTDNKQQQRRICRQPPRLQPGQSLCFLSQRPSGCHPARALRQSPHTRSNDLTQECSISQQRCKAARLFLDRRHGRSLRR